MKWIFVFYTYIKTDDNPFTLHSHLHSTRNHTHLHAQTPTLKQTMRSCIHEALKPVV